MFQIDGETHYGWARLTVEFHVGVAPQRTWEAHLSGYAYETVAGKAIHAGETQDGLDNDAESSPVTSPSLQLGVLALGSSPIPLWRREN